VFWRLGLGVGNDDTRLGHKKFFDFLGWMFLCTLCRIVLSVGKLCSLGADVKFQLDWHTNQFSSSVAPGSST
jgi:hypothetical protein